MEILGALIAGSAIGAVLGFVGAGGAMLSVPLLIYGFAFTPSAATTAALAVVTLAAISGLLPKFKTHDVLVREAFIISSIGLIANVGLSIIAHQLNDTVITTGLSIVLIAAGTSMLIKPVTGSEKKVPALWLILISIIIGSITGLFGIGGGFLAIPILVLFFKNSQAKATGTALLIIVLNSIIAFFAHYKSWSEVNWTVPISMAITAIIVARIASMKSSTLNPVLLRKGFAYLLYAISIFTLVQTWFIS